MKKHEKQLIKKNNDLQLCRHCSQHLITLRAVVTSIQFYQHFTSSFCAHRSQKHTKWHWWLDCLFALLGSVVIKSSNTMSVKSTPGVNFINVLRAAFSPIFFEKIQNQTVRREKMAKHFCVKAARKMLMKLTTSPWSTPRCDVLCSLSLSFLVEYFWSNLCFLRNLMNFFLP